MILGGFPVLEKSVSAPLKDKEMVETEERLIGERLQVVRTKAQNTYALLDADDSGGAIDNRSSTAAAASSQYEKADTHKKRFRKKTENVEDDADDEVWVSMAVVHNDGL